MPIRTVYGEGTLEQLGTLAKELSFTRALIVADPGIVAAGFAVRAARLLEEAAVSPALFQDFDANPDTRMVEAGREFAAANGIDGIVAIGGGAAPRLHVGENLLRPTHGSGRVYCGAPQTRQAEARPHLVSTPPRAG